MKKLILTSIMLAMILTIAACGAKTEVNENQVNEETNVDVETDADADTEDNTDIDVETEDNTDTDSSTDSETTVDTDNTTGSDLDSDNTASNLESIIETIYLTTGLEFPRLATTPLTKDNQSYMLGVDNFDFIEGVVSEPMMTSQAHSLVLFTVAEGSDIEAIKADIKANVDGRKWICVAVEPENIIVDSIDNMIILIMDDRSKALHDAFLATVN